MTDTVPDDTADLRRTWIEIAVVFAVAILPPLVHSFQWVAYRMAGYVAAEQGSFHDNAVEIVVMSIPAIVVTLFVMSRSNRSWADFGLQPFRPVADVGIACITLAAAYGLFYAVMFALAPILRRQGITDENAMSFHFVTPQSARDWLSLLVMAAFNGFAEEIVMRGFLITQLQRVLQSAAAAVLVSTALFAAYHAYQGAAGVIAGAATSVVFSIVFLRTKRFWPVAIAHAMADILAYIWLASGA